MSNESVTWMMKRVSLTENYEEIGLDEWLHYGNVLGSMPQDLAAKTLRSAISKINDHMGTRSRMKRVQDLKLEIQNLKEDIAMEAAQAAAQ